MSQGDSPAYPTLNPWSILFHTTLGESKSQMSQGDLKDSPAYSALDPWSILFHTTLGESKDQMSQGDLKDSPAYSTSTMILYLGVSCLVLPL